MTLRADTLRRATRPSVAPDLPRFDSSRLDRSTREALAELLLSMADDEFVIGFWDSEWTGIAPMLEEDVAFSSLAQDEIGHARVWYEMLAQLTGDDPDRIAFGRQPSEYRHAALLDHPRTDWAFSVARRWLYDTADAVRLAALAESSFEPLAQVVAKIRREESYHLMHMDVWLRRMATGGDEPRTRLAAAFERVAPDARSVLTPLATEATLMREGILAEPFERLDARWAADAKVTLGRLGISMGGNDHGRGRTSGDHGPDFQWLWNEFTMVRRSDDGATW